MSDATCTVDGCTSPVHAVGLCSKHDTRQRRRGTTDEGRPYGRTGCSLPDCDAPHYCKGFCTRHYQIFRQYGDPTLGPGPRNRGDAIGYVAAHNRVYAAKGSASDYACVSCGVPADNWAYDHADPREKRGGPKNLPYSPDPAHYRPLCYSCHAKADREAARRP